MLFIRIFTILFPIFAIIAIGYCYARFRPIEITTVNRLNMALFNPALLFSVFADSTFELLHYQQLAWASCLIVLGCGLLLFPLVRWSGINPRMFMPLMMFINTGNMGIPVALFTFGAPALPAAAVLLVVNALLHFTLGIAIVGGQTRWFSIIKSPLIQATLAGLLVNIAQIKIPEAILTPIDMLGACAIPLMLLSLGMRLVDIHFTHWKIGVLGAVARPLTGLLLFLLISPWFTLPTMQSGLLLIFSVLPPAVINYVLAEQYQQEPHKVAAIVMLGNLFSFISLPIALMVVLPPLSS